MSGPNLFLIAAPRAGSTQLARWLDSHAEISLSAVKEPNFFSAHEFDPERVAAAHLDDVDPARFSPRSGKRAQFAVFRGKPQYQALFSPMTTPWRMEASTSYLACPEAPDLIRSACPGARILLVTRDPLARALSHYRLARRTGRSMRSLGEELQEELTAALPLSERFLLRPSDQAPGLARFQAAFPADQCLSLRFEDMIADPAAALAQVARWLNIPAEGFDLGQDARNAGVAPRFPRLNRHLQRSGLKTRLRRALPASLKTRLKPLWFDASAPIAIAGRDRDALAAALARLCAPLPLLPSDRKPAP